MIFHFSERKAADYFESQLREYGFYYERAQDNDFIKRHLFGVRKKDFREINELNKMALAKYRRPFLGTIFLKYFVVGLTALMIILALIGFLKH